jgi:hypothetical protein
MQLPLSFCNDYNKRMVESEHNAGQSYPPPVSNIDSATQHFLNGINSGRPWFPVLLESMGLWTDETETFKGQTYHYLIEGEAFDWLLLAQRLFELAPGLIPEKEKYALLFEGKPPQPLTPEEFKNLMGTIKYHKYLNFFYGVTVEEALFQAVREEVRKERRANAWPRKLGEEDEAFTKIYGESMRVLLRQFRKEKHYHQNAASNLTQIKEFTYWCFKYRVRICEKAKVASDTNKGLEWLRKNGYNC